MSSRPNEIERQEPNASEEMASLIESRRIVICAGPGGVGKTTIAATLALRAAVEGKRALVVTIDPARRLARSLGLERLGNKETRIEGKLFSRAGLEPRGELWAMMLDVKRTSDEVIARHAKSKEQAERIYANHFYQTASTVLAGSLEYLAMEKLYDLDAERRFDLIVLDTPPTAHALDFLDAPNRVLDVLANDSLRWLATPAVAAGKLGVRAVGMGSGYLIRQISKFTGVETLQALAEFLMCMQGMYDGFKDRAARVKALLASDDTAFVLVTSPGAIEEARFFHSVLKDSSMPVGAVVMNRFHPNWQRAAGGPMDNSRLETWFNRDLAIRLADTVQEHQVLASSDHSAACSMAKDMSRGTTLCLVPILDRDVHDLVGLALMARCIFDREGLPAMAALPVIETEGHTGSTKGAPLASEDSKTPGSPHPNEPSDQEESGSVEKNSKPTSSSPLGGMVATVLLAFFFSVIVGCSAHRPSTTTESKVSEVEIEEVKIFGGDEESLALAALNDEELFQEGASAFAAGHLERAARAFSLLVAAFPESELYAVARYNAGFSWERAGEYLRALEFYDPLLEIVDGRDWLDTIYRVAESLYKLEDYAEAARILGDVLTVEQLPAKDRIRALTQQGVCLLEAGYEEQALHSLRSAVGRYHIEERSGEERLDVHFAAQAQFHIGEVFRKRFERARMDPAGTDFTTLEDDLEHKAQLLLSAQGHYLRTIRMGDAKWATASGHQVGRLYEELYRQLTSARMPTKLDDASKRVAYMELLREKVAVLLEKALEAYEKTLSTSERIGMDKAWRGQIEASLERVKSLLLDEDPWGPPTS